MTGELTWQHRPRPTPWTCSLIFLVQGEMRPGGSQQCDGAIRGPSLPIPFPCEFTSRFSLVFFMIFLQIRSIVW